MSQDQSPMQADAIFDAIGQIGVVPVVAIERVEAALPLADALLAGGIHVIEITFRTEVAAEVIDLLARQRPQLLVGAGTVLTKDNVQAAKAAGAQFALAPGCSEPIIAAARDGSLPFIPGICTPSDIERALACGCTLLKFFPAEAMGGLNTLKSLYGPYQHMGVRFVPTGGVNVKNLGSYLEHKSVAAVGGTWLATPADMTDEAWDTVRQRCAEAMRIVAEAKVSNA